MWQIYDGNLTLKRDLVYVSIFCMVVWSFAVLASLPVGDTSSTDAKRRVWSIAVRICCALICVCFGVRRATKTWKTPERSDVETSGHHGGTLEWFGIYAPGDWLLDLLTSHMRESQVPDIWL